MMLDGLIVALDRTKSVESPTSSYAQNGRNADFKIINLHVLLNTLKLLEFSALLLHESCFVCVDDLASSSARIISKNDRTETQSETQKISLQISPTEL